MKKVIVILVIVFVAVAVKANDGSFYAMGNTLFPLKETNIQLKKEVLNLTQKGDWMEVEVKFEFYNPGAEKEILLGFVTPPARGDLADKLADHPQIRKFTVNVDGINLDYKVSKQRDSVYKDWFDHIYHCKVRFKPGVTHIRHTYIYRGGNSVIADHNYAYVLVTGTTWANHEIEDFELNIKMKRDCYFSVPYSFDSKTANWKVLGVGKLSESEFIHPYDVDSTSPIRMAYIRNGHLQLKTKHFKPSRDLDVSVFSHLGGEEISLWVERDVANEFMELYKFFWKDRAIANAHKLSDEQLRLLRNLPYARAGYDFKDQTLKSYFSKFIWYLPDSAVKPVFRDYYFDREVAAIFENEEKRRNASVDK